MYYTLDPDQSCTLFAAMFSFAARYFPVIVLSSDGPEEFQNAGKPISSVYFYNLAVELFNKELRRCGDNAPPLSLLQALILITFNEIINGVRGVAWRSLGTCVRIAYELQLHLVDAKLYLNERSGNDGNADIWCTNEERRRAWWTIWEFDVFASTIRRCPTAIDWSQNATLLPVSDKLWFQGTRSASCFLELDPTKRWKVLQHSGNDSGMAWFLVINSITRDAHVISNPMVPPRDLSGIMLASPRAFTRNDIDTTDEDSSTKLAVLENCISCFTLALPNSLKYRDAFLKFDSSDSHGGESPRMYDSFRQSIHIMTQLARFMVYHYACFRKSTSQADDESPSTFLVMTSERAWVGYLEATDSIIQMVKNCSPNHVRYGHPLLANTVWIAAAVQLVHKSVASSLIEKQLAQSKYDLLRLYYNQYKDFWGFPSTLLDNLDTLEARLEDYINRSKTRGKGQSKRDAEKQTCSSQMPNTEMLIVGQDTEMQLNASEDTDGSGQYCHRQHNQGESNNNQTCDAPMANADVVGPGNLTEDHVGNTIDVDCSADAGLQDFLDSIFSGSLDDWPCDGYAY